AILLERTQRRTLLQTVDEKDALHESAEMFRTTRVQLFLCSYRRYHRTHCRITSPGKWRPLNGLVAVIGMNFYPTRSYSRTLQWNLVELGATRTADDIDHSVGLAGTAVAESLVELPITRNFTFGSGRSAVRLWLRGEREREAALVIVDVAGKNEIHVAG